MADAEHVAKLLTLSSTEWLTWRKTTRVKPDLREASLCDPNPQWSIRGAVTSNLEHYDLSDADLSGAILKQANLRGANLRGANLTRANLRYANLHSADLSKCRLDLANLTLANCTRAIFNGAVFWETVLARTNLHKAVGLERAKHGGPSIIDHRTLKRSGRLPDTFLTGLGVPPELAREMINYVRTSPNYESCFISYSTKDSEFVRRLHRALKMRNVHCWFAEHDMQSGKRIIPQIEEAIDSKERVLLVLSEHSLKSHWVNFEIKRTRERERASSTDVLFPLSLLPFADVRKLSSIDPDTGEDLARAIREFYIEDFSSWEDDSAFASSLSKLVANLRKE